MFYYHRSDKNNYSVLNFLNDVIDFISHVPQGEKRSFSEKIDSKYHDIMRKRVQAGIIALELHGLISVKDNESGNYRKFSKTTYIDNFQDLKFGSFVNDPNRNYKSLLIKIGKECIDLNITLETDEEPEAILEPVIFENYSKKEKNIIFKERKREKEEKINRFKNGNIKKEDFRESRLYRIFYEVFEYYINVKRIFNKWIVLLSGDGRFPYGYIHYLKKDSESHILESVNKIEDILCEIISPDNKRIPMKEMINKFGYPNEKKENFELEGFEEGYLG